MARATLILALLAALACGKQQTAPANPEAARRPNLLLLTLDTTRADHVAPEAAADTTPNLAALAARGVRFTQAYSTVPVTLPAHISMMTGSYPGGHGVHENGRRLRADVPLLAQRLRELGYATAAFVSGYPLERQFGLDRGFEIYDDDFGASGHERDAAGTTDRALAWLSSATEKPRFLWVHYYDPHEPYAPPEPFRSRFPTDPYRGEIAFMDQEIGRLLTAFDQRSTPGEWRVLVVADHGEGRGDHGEALHGNLLYQGVMRVPLLIAGAGIAPAVRGDAVSIRQVHPTFLVWAGDQAGNSLSTPTSEPILGEAMQPFLNYRWQPQVMATDGRLKLIRAGGLELYDVVADPAEARDLAREVAPDRALAHAVAAYPLPGGSATPATPVNDEARQRLASLGYVTSEGAPTAVPAQAPRAADQTRLFDELDLASRAFANADYERAVPLFRRILREDPGNLMSAVRLAVAQSFLNRDRAALESFATATRIDPESIEVKHYLAMHHLKAGRIELAAPLLEQVLAAQPERAPALEGLARIRSRQGRLREAAVLLTRAAPLAPSPAPLLTELGLLSMELGDTAAAIEALERARTADPAGFHRDLELGVLYLAANRIGEARQALDRVPPSHPDYPMALFKRAQVSVLLAEPDRAERIRAAWLGADGTTRPLIAGERLFDGLRPD